ncbi:MAG: YscO family type III secretion system apparatus protein [Pseudomonadota bacterium]
MSDVHAALAIQRRRLSELERALAEARREEQRCAAERERCRIESETFRRELPERERGLYRALWGNLVKMRDLDEVAVRVAALRQQGVDMEMVLLEAEQALSEAAELVAEQSQLYAEQAIRTEKYIEWVRLLDAESEKEREHAEEVEQLDDRPVVQSSLLGGGMQ